MLLTEAALVALGTGAPFAAASDAATAADSRPADAKSGPASADSAEAAVLMARLQGRQIEVTSERTAASTTYALPTGGLRTTAYPGPVRQKVDGVWQDIDTTLSDTGPALEPAVAAADISVSDGGDSALATVSKGGKSFGLGWDAKLPTPKLKDDTASYDLGDGQKLTVTALSQGFSQNVVLDTAPEKAPQYRIPVKLDGLKLSQAQSGHLLLKDSAGKLVAEAPAPMMWDASKDAASGESNHLARVDTRIETSDDGTQTLVLTPDAGYFKQDLTYPVVVDPTSTLAVTTDTWVATNYNDSQVSSAELKSGTYDAGTTKARSYLQFDVSAFKGKRIMDTNLALYSYYSSSCSTSGAGTEVRRVTSSWSSSGITWAAQPSTTTTGAVVNKAALGYDSSCPAGTMNFDIDAITQAWADGSPNYGLRVAGASETDSLTWRRFRSANYASGDGSMEPHLTVTYNSYPSTPSSPTIAPSQVNAYNGNRYVTSLTPTLSAKVADPDGSSTKGQFEITADPAFADTTYSYTGYGKTVASGATSSMTVPSGSAFPVGKHLRYRVRANDGLDFGPWSGYTAFLLNTGLPNAPAISCDIYQQDGWTAKADGAVSCTLNTDSTDGAGYYWGLDDPSVPNKKLDTTNGSGGDALAVSITPADGWHTLYAKTVDSGGNVSPATAAYSFGVGADGAGVISPREGDTTARRLTLAARGKSTYTGVTWQYRRGETDDWHTVPVGDVTASGSTVSAWPVRVTDGVATKLVWNTVGSLAEDGVVELRAAFTDGSRTGNSQSVETTLDRDAGDAPVGAVGPGSVNLLTGDYTLSNNDVKVFDATVSRTFSSRTNSSEQEGLAPVFGPGWTSSITATTSGAEYTQLRKTSATSLEILSADGSSAAFTAAAGGTWKPEIGAESMTLTGSFDQKFTLRDDEANVTVFARASTATPNWTVVTSASAVDDSAVVTASEAVAVDGKTLTRPKYVISPNEAVSSDTCQATPSTKGCRVLEFVYATATTATASTPGDYKQQVSSLRLWATDPGADQATQETVSRYTYDTTGKLVEVWDPRISPALKDKYTYDSDGRVRTLSDAGQLSWTFIYGKAGLATTAGEGMLLSASRPTLAEGSTSQVSGNAVTSLVYDVPLSGSAAPNAMDAATVATWGQDAAPTDATAVFSPAYVPASNNGADLAKDVYGQATITYINADGEESNTAESGAGLSTTEYDDFGNTVGSLTASNRELALGRAANADDTLRELGVGDLSTAERAYRLSSVSVFSQDGQRLTDTYGPVRTVTLTRDLDGTLHAGDAVPARPHTAYRYDEGRPSDAALRDLVTSTASGASLDGYTADADVLVSKTTYDWSTGEETSSTEDADGTAITTRSTFDGGGKLLSTSLPDSSATDAGTLKYTYYDGTGSGECHGRPEWAGQLCRTDPAAAITGGGSNPDKLASTVYTYNRWGGEVSQTQTINSVSRTLTLTYDPAGRTLKSVMTGGLGTVVPALTTTYDQDSGLVATKSTTAGTMRYGYDALGRLVSYEDGAGNTTTTSYDSLDRVIKVSDSAPSTTTYTYDTRSQVKTLTDSVAGSFTAIYDTDGNLTAETLPGGYTLGLTVDTTGKQVRREYTDSTGNSVLADSAQFTVHGRQVGDVQTDGTTTERSYTYDGVGRLTRAADRTDGGCAIRDYTFDTHSNRTALSSASDDCDSSTDDAVTQKLTHTYDSADRLTDAGYVYDAFGRTLNDGATELSYYANGLVRSETKGDRRNIWDLDAAGRLARTTAQSQGANSAWTTTGTVVSHYADGSDGPAWTTDGASVSRNVEDITGDLSAVTAANGRPVLQLTNLHGDVAVELPLSGSQPTVHHYDEYGNRTNSAPKARYGWLGGAQVADDTESGYVRLGVRLYDPRGGRFLQQDPEYGGGANAYAYCSGDPVNCQDVDGFSDYYLYYKLGKTSASDKSVFKYWKNHFKSIFPIPGRPAKITKKGQEFTLWPKIHGVSMYFPLKVNSIGKSYLQFGARFGHPDWPGGWIGFDIYKKKGMMKLEVRGHLGGAASIAGSSFSKGQAKPYWDKLGKNLKNTVKNHF
ncbi:DNRLRE domain-containing protein [Streptomyces griseoluteus]|uniref:DNRLRE domain-containing protein n=1 Tax=Streptomyces griseoluteus TaxID=29306 RepID=UPI0036F56501